MARREKILITLSALFLAFALNHAFLQWVSLTKVLAMNDVPAILSGYRQTPNLFVDGLRWWNGTWIQQGIHAYRPLASYLYWIESFIGLRFGFAWVGVIGVLLLAANALLAGVLAWRLTRWKPAVWLAMLLGVSLRFWNWSGATPDYWLAWYPVHQELLMNALLLGGIICFECWQESAAREYLCGAWACFVLGALTKEHVYIFPVFALALALWKQNPRVERKWALLHAALMGVGVLALWFYRAAIIVDPRNPTLKRIHLIRKPWLFGAFPFYLFVLTGQFWFPGLALLIFSIGGVLLRVRRSTLLARPYAAVFVIFGVLAIIALYCEITYVSTAEVFWYLFEDANGFIRLRQLVVLCACWYGFWLLWKYRKTEPTLLAFALLAISYLPVITYLGWHYTVASWFVRCAYWAVVFKCAWLDISPLLLPRLRKRKKLQPAELVARPKSSPA